MAGRTPHEARSALLTPLQRALTSLTAAQLFYVPDAPGGVEALRLSEEPRREDWREVLDEVEAAFHQWQTWA